MLWCLLSLWIAVGPPKKAIPATAPAVVAVPAATCDALDRVEKVLKIAAYLVGGGWVYFNFFKGRTYRPRLELRVTGQLSRRTTPEFVQVAVTVKNVGLSKVEVSQRGTALRLFAYDKSAKDGWKHLDTYGILTSHQWIEPGELLEEPALYELDLRDVSAIRAVVVVTGKKTMWEASCILV